MGIWFNAMVSIVLAFEIFFCFLVLQLTLHLNNSIPRFLFSFCVDGFVGWRPQPERFGTSLLVEKTKAWNLDLDLADRLKQISSEKTTRVVPLF